MFYIFLALSPGAIGVYLVRWSHCRSSLPPGPRGFSIIRNLLNLPKDYEWLHWSNYKRIYDTLSSLQQRLLLISRY